jgi:hypothetical protein
MKKRDKSTPEIELRPDGWERFKRAVGAAAQSGPKHRAAPKRKKRKARPSIITIPWLADECGDRLAFVSERGRRRPKCRVSGNLLVTDVLGRTDEAGVCPHGQPC